MEWNFALYWMRVHNSKLFPQTASLWPKCSVIWMLILDCASEMLCVQWQKLFCYTDEDIKNLCPFWISYCAYHFERCDFRVFVPLLQSCTLIQEKDSERGSPWHLLGLNSWFVLTKQFLGTINLSATKTVTRVC